jgi:hypothetical protein
MIDRLMTCSSMRRCNRYSFESKLTSTVISPPKEELFHAVVKRRAELMAVQFTAVLIPHVPPAFLTAEPRLKLPPPLPMRN